MENAKFTRVCSGNLRKKEGVFCLCVWWTIDTTKALRV
uniref:Uncharacterized protein n=1 Tax=Rhizophora mucronata TaxID=61149 RepID=A0A2P2P1Z7_RHIMU